MGLRSFVLIFVVVGLVAAALLYAFLADGRGPTVYSAPGMVGLVEELIAVYPRDLDVRFMGSVLAANLIKGGKIPDVYLTVDAELVKDLPYRRLYVVGVFNLSLVCHSGHASLSMLKTARLGLADPNLAPVGYRSLAALYLISVNEGLDVVGDVEKELGVVYRSEGDVVVIDVRNISSGGRFYIRDDLNGVYALLENGAVDCIFVYTPYVVSKKLWERYTVVELPAYAVFNTDPPARFRALLRGEVVDVGKFVAVAASFTEAGDSILNYLVKVDVSKYGFSKAGAGGFAG